MANHVDDNQEMSMEEILASIRKYVTDDPSETAAPSKNQKVHDFPSTHSAHSAGEEILDLKKIQEASYKAPLEKSTTEEIAAFSPPSPPVVMAPVAPLEKEQNSMSSYIPPVSLHVDSLTSGEALTTSAQSLSKLIEASRPAPVQAPVLGTTTGLTLENLALEALKPMLKNWLDANLPQLVETIVQQEIKNLTKQLS